jgi:serine/threonine protein kinase
LLFAVAVGSDKDDTDPRTRRSPSEDTGDQTVARPSERSERSMSYRMILEPRAARPPKERGPASRSAPSTSGEDAGASTRASPDPALDEDAPAQSPPNRHAPGQVIAQRYRLIEPIGSGGMGYVWRARSLTLDIDVALKLVRHDSDVPLAARRLQREARATVRVVHPSVVRLFELGTTEQGTPFIAMELLEGELLASHLQRVGRLPPLEAVRLLLPILGALAAAHRQGIVHRDVKPANIVLVADGRCTVPKLIDFGIVGETERRPSRKLTAQGLMLGSPVYMAPEQVFGGRADVRIDVWAASAVLYELVTGQRPFSGDNSALILERLTNNPLPHHEAFEPVPELFRVVRRGMAKDPAERFPDADALGRVLAAWARARGATCDVAGQDLAARWDVPDGA